MLGGFGLCGIPENLIQALMRKNVRNLTTISNNVGIDNFGLGLLLANHQIKKHIGTYVGENKLLEEMVLKGEIDLSSIRKGHLPSVSAPAGPASRLSLLLRATAPSSAKKKKSGNSMDV